MVQNAAVVSGLYGHIRHDLHTNMVFVCCLPRDNQLHVNYAWGQQMPNVSRFTSLVRKQPAFPRKALKSAQL